VYASVAGGRAAWVDDDLVVRAIDLRGNGDIVTVGRDARYVAVDPTGDRYALAGPAGDVRLVEGPSMSTRWTVPADAACVRATGPTVPGHLLPVAERFMTKPAAA
jgi:hypothetical protein